MNVLASASSSSTLASRRAIPNGNMVQVLSGTIGTRHIASRRPVLAALSALNGARARSTATRTLSTDGPSKSLNVGYRIPQLSSSSSRSIAISPLTYPCFSPSRRNISTSTTSLFSFTLPTRLSSPTTAQPQVPPSSSPNSRSSAAPEPEPEAESEPEDPNAPPQTAMARLKLLFKRYGWYALGMYTVLSALDFSLTFALIHLVGLERMEPLIRATVQQYRVLRFGAEEARAMKVEDERKRIADKEEEKAQGGKGGKKKEGKSGSGWISKTVLAEMALAYPIHKVALLPVRAGLTVAWTPKFVGWLTRRGWVGKGGYTRAATHAQDKIRTAKERVKERVKDIRE